MCGLFGFIGDGYLPVDRSVAYTLGILNLLRGTDGSGVIMANTKTKEVSTYKTPQDFLGLWWKIDDHKSGLRNLQNNVFLFHNRWTTVGKSDGDSAHPYELDNLLMMHNGTVKSRHILDKVEKEGHLTDSQSLLHEIKEHGLEKAIMDLDEEEDAYAIVLYDKATGLVKFVKNKKRPLFFAVHNKRKVMYYSSEEKALRFAIERAGQDVTYFAETNNRVVFTVDPEVVILGECSWETEDLPEAIVRPKKVIIPTHYYGRGRESWEPIWQKNANGDWQLVGDKEDDDPDKSWTEAWYNDYAGH